MKTWLVVDCHNLAWRAYHTMGYLSYNEFRTGVIYGFLRDIGNLFDLLRPDHFVFCFDCNSRTFRELVSPGYKERRRAAVRKYSKEQQWEYKQVKRQIRLLREEYLHRVGFKNVFCEDGYESDDLVASVCETITRNRDRGIIVSSDQDFYQLLNKRIRIYCPKTKRIITRKRFSEQYGIEPSQWVDVKAIAGCRSDEVPGIPSIGEKTACKFLNGSLDNGSKAFEKITKGNSTWRENIPLVELPYDGTPEFELQDDQVSEKKWKKLMDELGMKSLRGSAPTRIGFER